MERPTHPAAGLWVAVLCNSYGVVIDLNSVDFDAGVEITVVRDSALPTERDGELRLPTQHVPTDVLYRWYDLETLDDVQTRWVHAKAAAAGMNAQASTRDLDGITGELSELADPDRDKSGLQRDRNRLLDLAFQLRELLLHDRAAPFTRWELRTGNHPTEAVRRVGIALQHAYLNANGGRHWITDPDRYIGEPDPDRHQRWDRMADLLLASPAVINAVLAQLGQDDTDRPDGHIIDLRDGTFTIQHTLACRGNVDNCPVSGAARRAEAADLSGLPPGRYRCGVLADSGVLFLTEPDDTELPRPTGGDLDEEVKQCETTTR